MILGIDYKFRDDMVDDKSPETVPIELLIGKFKGIVYRYTNVMISEPTKEDDPAKLKFGYDVLYIPYDGDHTPDAGDLNKDTLFNKVLGVILNELILDSVGIKDDGENDREYYSEEPNNK